jgi:hypothetical protein
MAIIISKNGESAEKVNQSPFELEDKLQDFIYKNPDAIPLYDIDEDIRLFIAAREFGTRSGPIDALGFDSSGNIYVVETKLYKNPDKRQVVAQALDYGASLWRHATDFDEFTQRIDNHCQKEFSSSFAEKYAEFFNLNDASESMDRIKANLSNGVIKFVVLMDSLHSALKDLVIYVNQNSMFDIYAVELEYYKHNEFEIVIPKIFGAEVKKSVSTRNDSNKFDNQKIISWIEDASIDNLVIDFRSTTKSYVRLTSKQLDTIMPPRLENNNSWSSNTAYYYEIQTSASGWIKILLVLNSKGASEDQKLGQSQVSKSARLDPKDGWTYFVAKAWNVNTDSGDEGVKESIIEILTLKIPELESKILE